MKMHDNKPHQEIDRGTVTPRRLTGVEAAAAKRVIEQTQRDIGAVLAALAELTPEQRRAVPALIAKLGSGG